MPQIPPLPQYIVIVARDSGQRYVLTHAGPAGGLFLALSTEVPASPEKTIYGPNEGPFIRPDVRLFVQSGTLQAEPIAQGDFQVYNRPITTRAGHQRAFLVITIPDDWAQGDPFIFTEVVL